MSTAAAVDGAGAAKASKKKLILVVVLALLLLGGVAGGGALMWLKARAQAEAEIDETEAEAAEARPKQAARRDPGAVPTFVPLDPFTVNLADRDVERYAQIGISLELHDAAAGERIKGFMPAIRNNILMVLSHKRASELLERAGKEKLAEEVLRETERALGIAAGGKGGVATRPVRAVHFSNFIIQ